MIAAELAGSPTAADRWAYATLVDLACLLPAAPGTASSVATRVCDMPGEFEVIPGEVRIGRGAIDRVIALAGAATEQESRERDRHGRVPSTANPLVQLGSARTLPMHDLATRFGAAVDQAAGAAVSRLAPWPDGKSWAAAMTHDLDVVAGWPLFAAMRWLELMHKGEVGRAIRAMGAALGAIGSGPVKRSVDRMLSIEGAAGVRATWFVLAGKPSFDSWRRGDVTYRLDGPAARALLEALTQAKHEVGLHGSLGTAESSELMQQERTLVQRMTGAAPAGIRQHFLRMRPGVTAIHARTAGFSYDSTFGFADRSGFRLGTADVVQSWNAATGSPIDLMQAPLAWMDRTFSKYQGEENPERWVDDALALARICREAGGLFVALWHPNVVPALGFPDTWAAFERLVQSLVKEGAYIVPLQEQVAWRSARRALRGTPAADGGVRLTSDRPGSWIVTVRRGGSSAPHPWPAGLQHG